MRIKTGDTVRVIAGKDKGFEGTVSSTVPKANKVIVAGANIAKRHTKARSEEEPGGIIDTEMPIHVSNVALISPKDGKPTKVGYRMVDGNKERFCKRTDEKIPEAG